MMQKVTIIIICYNSERTLPAALDSVCGQTYQNLEILVVDDASSDHTMEIAENYQQRDARIRVIRHAKNQGILAARKTGVEAATGEFIMNLDGDDMYLPQTCERALHAILTANADFIQFGTQILPEGEIPESEILLKEKKLNIPAFFIDCNKENNPYAIVNACYREKRFTYTQWNKIYRADLLKQAYGYIHADQVTMGEDMYCLFVVTSLARKMAVIEERLYIYRFGQGISCMNKADPMKAFQRSCLAMEGVPAIERYARETGKEKEFMEYCELLRKEMLHRTLSRFYPEVPAEQRGAAIRLVRQYWTIWELLGEYLLSKKSNQTLLICRKSEKTDNPIHYIPYVIWHIFQRLLHRTVLYPDNRNGL